MLGWLEMTNFRILKTKVMEEDEIKMTTSKLVSFWPYQKRFPFFLYMNCGLSYGAEVREIVQNLQCLILTGIFCYPSLRCTL